MPFERSFQHSDAFKSIVGLEYVTDELKRPDASVDESVYTAAAFGRKKSIY
jgi:outer membrane receptor for ferrienterochelin and colicins